MRGLLLVLSIAGCVVGCSCQDTGITGVPDAVDEAHPDPVDEVRSDPVDGTEPACWDRDDDGYRDEVCGGDDCDDSRSDVYPGASEVCLDGVDQDCDGIIDGPMLVGDAIQISDNPGDSRDGFGVSPGTLAWTGSEYILAWTEIGRTPMDSFEASTFISRLSPTGDFLLERTWLWWWMVGQFAWSGSELGFAGSHFITRPGLRFVSVSPVGTSLLEPVYLSNGGKSARITWTGEEYVLFWIDDALGHEDIYYGRLDGDGTITHAAGPLTDHSEMDDELGLSSLEVAWAGSGVGLIWVEDPDGSGEREDLIYAYYPYDHAGLIEEMRVTDSDNLNRSPDLAWTGSEFGIVWQTQGGDDGLYVAMTSAGGHAIGEPHRFVEVGERPLIVWTGSEFSVAYGEMNSDDSYIHIVRMQPDGDIEARGAEITLESPTTNHGVRLTWSGSEFGIVYVDERDDSNEVFFQRAGMCD